MEDGLFRRWEEVERILDEVLELERPEQLARLSSQDLDHDLRRRVEELLRVEEEAPGFLAHPPSLDAIPAEGDPEPLPERVGPYRIEGVLGHGGMGTVLAGLRDDAGFVQRVAIKRLHPGLWGAGLRERFLRERTILAGLEHPNIARLLEGGVDTSGLPYFAMEQVDGRTITEHCRREGLDLAARLRLVLQVCDAVEFAHARLVVHRDLKPANVLVTPRGEVKLLDFGIAKLLEEGEGGPALTATVARMLTPAYAAPEQFQGGPITVATDVYQLGLLLYELLAGRPAYGTERSPLALQRRVLETEPERPSKVAGSRRLAGDLDAIVLQALRKEPSERYPSVEALHRDLEAHLGSRPVAARRGSGLYRVRKYVRRHRIGVAASALLAVSLTGGLIGVGTQARIAAAERSRAEAIQAFLLDELLHAPAPEASLGRPLTVAEVLDAASRSVGHAFQGIPATEADVRLTLARTYASLGRSGEAREHAERARALLARAHGLGSGGVLRARTLLAELDAGMGRYAQARAEIEDVLARQSRALPPGDPDLLASRRVLGQTLVLQGELSAAEAVLREALALQQRERPSDWRLGVELRGTLVDALIARMAPTDTERLCHEILEIQRRHLGPEHPDVATTLERLSGVLQRKLRWDEALAVAGQALQVRRRVHGDEHPLTADAWDRIAKLHSRLNEGAEAVAAGKRAHAIYVVTVGPGHPRTLEALQGIGIQLRQSGRLPEAERIYRQVLEGFRSTLGAEHPSTLRAQRYLQILLVAAGRETEARRTAAEIREVYERTMARPDADPETIDDYVMHLLNVDPADQRNPRRALALAERACAQTGRQAYHLLLNLALAQRDTGSPDLALATLRETLALPEGLRSWTAAQAALDLLNAEGREAEAIPFLEDLLRRQRAARGEDFVVAKTERLLALQHARLGEADAAEPWFRTSLSTYRACRPEDDWEIGRIQSELGGFLLERGSEEEAAPLLREGLRKLEADPLVRPQWREEARARLAKLPR